MRKAFFKIVEGMMVSRRVMSSSDKSLRKGRKMLYPTFYELSSTDDFRLKLI